MPPSVYQQPSQCCVTKDFSAMSARKYFKLRRNFSGISVKFISERGQKRTTVIAQLNITTWGAINSVREKSKPDAVDEDIVCLIHFLTSYGLNTLNLTSVRSVVIHLVAEEIWSGICDATLEKSPINARCVLMKVEIYQDITNTWSVNTMVTNRSTAQCATNPSSRGVS